MARKISPADVQLLQEDLREHLHRSLLAAVGELICMLQQRHLPEARRIAAQMVRDLPLCDSPQAQYFISRIVWILADDKVFDRCDRLSAWLLFLEREIESLVELALADRVEAARESHCGEFDFTSREPNFGCDPVSSVHAGPIKEVI